MGAQLATHSVVHVYMPPWCRSSPLTLVSLASFPLVQVEYTQRKVLLLVEMLQQLIPGLQWLARQGVSSRGLSHGSRMESHQQGACMVMQGHCDEAGSRYLQRYLQVMEQQQLVHVEGIDSAA